jgi:hypothetical protein
VAILATKPPNERLAYELGLLGALYWNAGQHERGIARTREAVTMLVSVAGLDNLRTRR